MQIKIYVVKTELSYLRNLRNLRRTRINRKKVDIIKEELFNLFDGLTVDRKIKDGLWRNSKDKMDKDRVQNWEILTKTVDFYALEGLFKALMEELKQVTKQESQLYTLNPCMNPVFV